MAHKKVAKIIATAIVVNNLSSSVVLGKEVNLIEKNKDNSVINQSISDSKRYNNIFRIEKTVGDTEEFLKIINDGNLEEIKLSRDIDLSNLISSGLDVRTSNVVIDGQGYSIYVPKLAENFNRDFFTLQGDGIVLKNLNIVCKDDDETLNNKNNLITISGDNITLENVFIESNFNRAVNILEGKNIYINDCKIVNNQEKGNGLKVENGAVTLNNLDLQNKSGVGIDILGKDSKVDLKGDIKIDSPIEIRGQFRDGGILNCNNNQLIHEKRVFGYTYYNVAKETELVRNKDEFLEAIDNNIVKNIKLMNNIDLRGHESEYYKVFEKEIKVDKNNYHITM
ncbi:pectate lyase-like adhesive domain-containing protein [Clostridium perfringens]